MDSASPRARHGKSHASGSNRGWLRVLLVVAILVLLVLALRLAADRKRFSQLVTWVDDHPVRGVIVMGAAQVAFTLALIPTAVLAIAGGALFGFVRGMVLMWAASLAGETAAFVVGRYLFRGPIERLAARWPTWAAIEAALVEDGWRLVLLLRCAPTPLLLNYALGASSLPFSSFFYPSVVGIAPGIACYAWAGHLLKDLSDGPPGTAAASAATPPRTRAAFAAVSGAAAVVALAGSAVWTKRAIDRRLARVGSGGADAELGRSNSHHRGERAALLSGQRIGGAGVALRVLGPRSGVNGDSGTGRSQSSPAPTGPRQPSGARQQPHLPRLVSESSAMF